MKDWFKIDLLSDSAIFRLSDKKGREYAIEIGPKRAAEYFALLFHEGAAKTMEAKVEVKGLYKRRLGQARCHITLFKDHGLFACSTPDTGESRNLEIYPKAFAAWLARCLESRPNTQVEYETMV